MTEAELRMQAQIVAITTDLWSHINTMEDINAINKFNGVATAYHAVTFKQVATNLHAVASSLQRL
jgi:hypothetical protein